MEKFHRVAVTGFDGSFILFKVDGRPYRADLARFSKKLARASEKVKNRFEVCETGYGIHWPDLDEDLSIAGLIGMKVGSRLKRRRLRSSVR